MSGHRIGAQALAYLAAKAAPAIAALLLLPILVRSMTPEAFTRYGQGMALVNALIGFAAGWMNQSQMRFVHEPEQAELRAARSIALLVNLLGGVALIAMAGIWAGSGWWTEAMLYAAMLAGLMLTTDALARQSTGRFVSMEVARSALLILAISVAAFVLPTLSASVVLASIALSYLIPIAWSGPAVRNFGEILPRAARHRALEFLVPMWRFGWPVGAWICLTAMMQVFDRSFARQVFGAEVSAHYIAVFEIYFRGVSLVIFPLLMAAYPEMIRRWSEGDRDGALRLGQRVQRLQAYALVPVVILSAWSVDLVMPLLGKSALPSDRLLAGTFACGAVVWQWVLAAHKPLELERQTPMMLGLAVAALVVFTAVLLTVGRSGLVPIAAAYVVSGLVYVSGCHVVLRGLPKSNSRGPG